MNSEWTQANQVYLAQAITRLKKSLESHLNQESSNGYSVPPLELSGLSPPTALERLCRIFRLSPFERDILLFCAAIELDVTWGNLFTQWHRDPQSNYPTFNLALAILPDSYWGAITPSAPLRKWQMIDIGAGKTITNSPLRIDERILHFLLGIQQLDERLLGMVQLSPNLDYLVDSHQEIVQKAAAIWSQPAQKQLPVVQLCGEEGTSKKAIAAAACKQLGAELHIISAEALPTDTTQLNSVQSLWERECFLNSSALLLDCDNLETSEPNKESAIARFIETINCPLIVTTRDRRRSRQRPVVIFDVAQPTTEEQQFIWQSNLGEIAYSLKDNIDILVSHFNLSSTAIQAVCLQAKTSIKVDNDPSLNHNILWDICRTQARPKLEDLAQRIDAVAGWEDLILPEKERNTLQEIAIHIRQKMKVYESWGFTGKSKKGLGIGALFAGQSGTGKTMAAEVIGETLKLDVYRIDLSSVVSKYIGETEKNLGRVFDAAEGGGAILLFDEADALFGKRSDVKDSHDRYANMEVSYLLQRMEAYRGLAILTTNLKGSIDQAFLRRLRFVVQFPFPDATQREEIWKRVFPKKTPTEGLDFKKLSSLNVAGGNIRNIAINAAFLAAEANEPVMMKHLLQAAKSEYVKLERPMTDNEVRGWV